jgi:hypothetical protein
MGVVATACVAVVSAPVLGSMSRSHRHAERSFDHGRRLTSMNLFEAGVPWNNESIQVIESNLGTGPLVKLANYKVTGDKGDSPSIGGPSLLGSLAGGLALTGPASAAEPAAKQQLLDASTPAPPLLEAPRQPLAQPAALIAASFSPQGAPPPVSPPPPPVLPGDGGTTPPDPTPPDPTPPDPTPPDTPPVVIPPIDTPTPTDPEPLLTPIGGQDPPPPPLTASAAPEPTTWAMMLVGLGFIGAALRRRAKAGLGAEAGRSPS